MCLRVTRRVTLTSSFSTSPAQSSISETKRRGSSSALRDKPAVQRALAEAEILLSSARAFVFEAVGTVWDAAVAGRATEPRERALVHLACSNAVRAAGNAVAHFAVTRDGTSYREFLVEDWEPTEADERERLKRWMEALVHRLDEREQTVVRMRYGLGGRPISTLEEVGRKLHLSRERSRQIQQKALRKMRMLARGTHLDDYV